MRSITDAYVCLDVLIFRMLCVIYLRQNEGMKRMMTVRHSNLPNTMRKEQMNLAATVKPA